MKINEFFKPSQIKIIVFVILIIIAYLILSNTTLKIYPCKIQPVIQNPPEFKEALCVAPSLLVKILGVRIIYDPLAYILFYSGVLIIPYLLACLIGYLLRKKGLKPLIKS